MVDKGAEIDLESASRQLQAEVAELQAQWRDEDQFRAGMESRRPRATWAMVAVLAAVWGLELVWGGADWSPLLVRMGALVPSLVADGEWFRLVTACLLHGGWLHFVFVAAALAALGTFLERLLGGARLVVLVLASGLGGSVASSLAGEHISVGASGADWGVLGLWPRGLLPAAMLPRLQRVTLGNLGVNLLISFLPGIDLWAHVGGGVVGAGLVASGAITAGLSRAQVDRRTGLAPAPAVMRIAAGALAGVWALAGMWALAVGTPWVLWGEPETAPRTLGAGLEIRLPVFVELSVPPGAPVGGSMVSYGESLQDPFVVVASVTVFASADEADAARARVWQEAAHAPPGFRLASERALPGVDPGAVRVFADPWGGVVEQHLQRRGHRLVMLDVTAPPGAPDPWAATRALLLQGIRERGT